MTTPIIEFDGVSKRFGGVRALQGVSFAVPGGEVHALVGENGSGKSTLIRICGGVFPPDEGRVRFEGRDVAFANPLASRAAGVSVVHQEILICPDLTAAQNVLLGHELPKRGGLIDWSESITPLPIPRVGTLITRRRLTSSCGLMISLR